MTLDVTDLTVSRGGARVFADVSLSAADGEFVGLVGPNGAGKSTLLHAVTGRLDPDGGTVSVDGDDVAGLSSRAASRRVALLPQNPALTFEFTVREVVEMGRHPHRSRFGSDPARGIVDRALDRTGVAHLADRSVTAVSGGERRRVLLARTLAQDAPLTLLDEPTASLDVNHQLDTLEVVREVVDEGRTAVAAIHDLDLAARYCDRLVLLADGGVLARGHPGEVLTTETLRAAFGAEARVVRDPVTGDPHVTALPDRETDAAGSVHLLGTGEGAARACSRLAAAGFDVSVGPVPAGDAVATTAAALDCPAVTVPPFAAPDDDARAAAERRVAGADATVLASLPAGDGALPLLELADGGDAVVVADGLPARDGRAGRLLDGVRTRGRVAEDVVVAAADAVAAAPGATAED